MWVSAGPAGPRQDDSYNDTREDYSHTEPAVDYNAGFSGARPHVAVCVTCCDPGLRYPCVLH